MCCNIFRKKFLNLIFLNIERTKRKTEKKLQKCSTDILWNKLINQLPLSFGESADTFGFFLFACLSVGLEVLDITCQRLNEHLLIFGISASEIHDKNFYH